MTIEAERLESWIGAEVLDAGGEKVGKLGEVYFRGEEPVVASVRSGLGGRKHHLGVLRGARVSREHVRLAIAADGLVSSDGDPLKTQIAALSAHDDRLRDLPPADLEGSQARDERLKAAAEAKARADELEAEAARRAEDERTAASKADDAGAAATEARKERETAEAKAREARDRAGGG